MTVIKNEDGIVKLKYEINIDDFSAAGEASSDIKKILRQLGIDSQAIRKAAIATYEAEINVVIHSEGGFIEVEIVEDKIKIKVRDQGPGIEDLELAMKKGYSTATEKVRELGFGAGMGLPNMKRYSDEFDIDSAVGVFTEINMAINIK